MESAVVIQLLFHYTYGCAKQLPHRAVCSEVLNLPSQVGSLLGRSALAQAYRVTTVRPRPYKWVLAQNIFAATRTQQGHLFYTIKTLHWIVSLVNINLLSSGAAH
jgi:hypothetical protein